MKCSIVMPVLDGEAFVEAAIQSVLSQTYTDWELIVIDGGSQDGTVQIVEAFQADDARITLIHQTGQGIYPAIFEGFDLATGDVFSWLNADDLYPVWALKTVTHFMMSGAGRSWVTGFPGAWDRQGSLRYLLPVGIWPRRWIRKGYFHLDLLGCIQAESTFFHRSLWDKLSVADRKAICSLELAGDYLLWRKLSEHASLTSIPSLVGGFRNHGGNRSIAQASRYMDEVYSTGTLRLSPRLGRRIGQLFSLFASAYGYRRALQSSAQLNRDNQDAASR